MFAAYIIKYWYATWYYLGFVAEMGESPIFQPTWISIINIINQLNQDAAFPAAKPWFV